IGLGMAVTPHAKSLLDLKDRVEVAYAYSPSRERRAKFKEKFFFPQCERLETILEDKSVDAVMVLTPPNTHIELVEKLRFEAGQWEWRSVTYNRRNDKKPYQVHIIADTHSDGFPKTQLKRPILPVTKDDCPSKTD
ncbi:hypothetical protein B4Q13_25305, partial [Lacticaseibacillus rhamnosus]